jgi:FKBP-type peptidyl-prolyl cis-trans isomerase (trigger factor)
MAGKKTTTVKEVKENAPKPFEKGQDGTIELRILIPWKEIEVEWKKAVEFLAQGVNLPGFRKGKAPAKLVEEKLDKAKIKDEVIKHLLPPAYAKAIKDNNIKPIIDPQIHVDGELNEGQDWMFHALTCEAPAIDLGNYKAEIKKITAKSKIVVPGKEQEAPKFDEIVGKLMESAKVTIPGILIQREADRLISQMLDEIKKLGMTLDSYLASTGKTVEDLRADYAKKAENDLKLEFVLQKISVDEKITVDDADIAKTIENAKPEERASLEANKYLLASIIRQQKTLDFLKNL